MATTVRKWGNSLGVRIPKAIAEQASLGEGSAVEVSVDEAGNITIRPKHRPKRRRRVTLKELLSKIKPGQRHGEWNKSEPAGKEII